MSYQEKKKPKVFVTRRLPQRAWEELIHPEDRAVAMETLGEAAEKVTGWNIEHRLLFKDGSIGWVNTVGEAIPRGQGKAPILYGTTQDITKHKIADEILAGEKSLLKAIIDNMPVMITHYDPDTDMLYLNREFE